MIITNKKELPEALVRACSPDKHNKDGCLSATTLKKGVREILLELRHWDKLTEDVSERIWSLFGTAVHSLLEMDTPDTFAEEYFEIPVINHKVTGRVDCYDMKKGIIHDYKTASVWKVMFNNFEDWHTQGMIYAYLLKKAGLEVNECRFIALLKDFSKRDSKLKDNYPDSEIYIYKFDVTQEELDKIEKFIFDKVKSVEEYESVKDDDLPLCSEEERWAEKTKYAVMKKGRKTALRVFGTKEEAMELANKLGYDESCIELRTGTDKKCENYCSCCEFCSYWKEHYGKQKV